MLGILLPKPNIDFRRLSDHRYSAFGKSICEPLLESFWELSSSLVPRWVAPNTLTLIGLLLNVLGTLPLLLFGNPVSHDESPYFLLLFAICLFGYQTLDAVDGKHARKIARCSVLGELFDHGCDAISMAILPLGYFRIVGLGSYPILMFVEYLTLCTVFYKYHWQSYVTGIFMFDKLSVTEIILSLEIATLVSAFFGVPFWSNEVPICGFDLKVAQFLFVFICCMVFLVQLLRVVLQDGVGKFGTTVANTSVLSPVVPLAMLIGSAVWIAVRSPTNIYQTCPTLFLATYGAISAKLSQNLEMAFVTTTSLPQFDTILFGPACLIINQMFDCIINEYFLLWVCFIYCHVVLFHYCGSIALQVADYLNIYIFRVDKPPAVKEKPAVRQQTAENPPATSTSGRYTGMRTRGMTAK